MTDRSETPSLAIAPTPPPCPVMGVALPESVMERVEAKPPPGWPRLRRGERAEVNRVSRSYARALAACRRFDLLLDAGGADALGDALATLEADVSAHRARLVAALVAARGHGRGEGAAGRAEP